MQKRSPSTPPWLQAGFLKRYRWCTCKEFASEVDSASTKNMNDTRGVKDAILGVLCAMVEEKKEGVRILRNQRGLVSTSDSVLCYTAVLGKRGRARRNGLSQARMHAFRWESRSSLRPRTTLGIGGSVAFEVKIENYFSTVE